MFIVPLVAKDVRPKVVADRFIKSSGDIKSTFYCLGKILKNSAHSLESYTYGT